MILVAYLDEQRLRLLRIGDVVIANSQAIPASQMDRFGGVFGRVVQRVNPLKK